LGQHAESVFNSATVAIVGLGGGGSHVAQQLAHVGIGNFILLDSQEIEESNMNRLIGATAEDVRLAMKKVVIAKRLIHGIRPSAVVVDCPERWQDVAIQLRTADVIFGCLDGFAARRELEACARRFLIPYIDIGMDVYPPVGGWPPRMVGQIIASIPGRPCMTCFGFLNETNLAREASKYGAAGINPQVVWANGILASTAVGIAVDILTGWNNSPDRATACYSFDGNSNTVARDPRLKYLPDKCVHYPTEQAGEPLFRKV
jgi:hypothetical protein